MALRHRDAGQRPGADPGRAGRRRARRRRAGRGRRPTATPGDKARFVRGVERALLDGEADVGVHSAKDLPGEMAAGLEIAAVPGARGPGRRLDRRRAPRSTTCPRAPGSAPPACAAAPSCWRSGPTCGSRSCTATSTPACASSPRASSTRSSSPPPGCAGSAATARSRFAIPLEADGPGRRPGRAGAADPRPATSEPRAPRGDRRPRAPMRELTAERAAVVAARRRLREPGRRPRPDRGRAPRRSTAFVGLPDGSEWVRDRVEGEPPTRRAGTELAERLLGAGAATARAAEAWRAPSTVPRTARRRRGAGDERAGGSRLPGRRRPRRPGPDDGALAGADRRRRRRSSTTG